jgi:hypothetical protein
MLLHKMRWFDDWRRAGQSYHGYVEGAALIPSCNHYLDCP